MKRILLFFTLLTLSVAALAQRVSFDAVAPLTVVAGDRFRVEFVLKNAAGSDFVAPQFDGFKVLAGPTVSTGSQMSWVNGVQSSSTSETRTYFVEASTTASKGTISQASITAGGTTYKSRALAINIVASTSPQGAAAQGGGSAYADDDQPQSSYSHPKEKLKADDILLRMELSKNECFKGEAVAAQLKLYTRVAIGGLSDFKYSAFNGFWTQEIEAPNPPQATRATINGKVYEGFVLRQWLIYPQKAGLLEVEQTTLKAQAQIVVQSSGQSLFDQFFGGGSTVSRVDKFLATGPVRLNVKPLPTAGAPVGLSPAVGKFTLTSSLSSQKIAANAAASLIVTLSGTGDFPLLEPPVFQLPAEFEQYDTKTTDNLKSTLAGTSGSRSWEFPFIARSEGQYTIPSIEMAYFDPATRSYKTLKTEEYQIEVTRGVAGASAAVIGGVSKEEVKMLGQDIRYIKTTPLRSTGAHAWLYSATFFLAVLGLIGLFIVLLFVFRRQMQRRADVVGTKNRKANKVALRRLKAAKRSLDAADRRSFLDEMLRALWGFVGDKFNVEVSELTKGRIEDEFAAHATSECLSREFLNLVEECEMAQYAPSTQFDMAGIYERALSLLGEL